MKILKDSHALIAEIRLVKQNGSRASFVPTMGSLHRGHLQLVKLAKEKSDCSVVSIFVNPSQFNDSKDFERYPRDFDRDCKLLEEAGVDLVFLPDAKDIYGDKFQSEVFLPALSEKFEGSSRPGHFRGVATVVSILFNIVQPNVAVFGEKDFQQLRIIEQMVEDLKFNVEIVRGPLVRDSDGLALSSRNVRLSTDGRKRALSISKGLFKAQNEYRNGERKAEVLSHIVKDTIEGNGLIVDYANVVDEKSLEVMEQATEQSRILVAAEIEGVRLIDNYAIVQF